MRIVGGTHRGRALVAPKGHHTRPTADRTRQALFDVLEHAPWAMGPAGRRVLDLFAGAGALGLEALSRGAAFCRFVDDDMAARAAIGRNLAALDLVGRAEVTSGDATRLGRRGANSPDFDLVFLDPPYAAGLIAPALAALHAGAWLSEDALVVVEQGGGEPELRAADMILRDQRTWGRARVSFLSVCRTDARYRPV